MQDNGIYLWIIIIFVTFTLIIAATKCATTSDTQNRRQICLARNGTPVEDDGHYLDSSLVRCRNDSGVFYIHTRTGLKLVPVVE